MGKIKSFLIGAAALSCPILAGTSTSAGLAIRTAAYYSAAADNLGYGETSDISGDLDSIGTEIGGESDMSELSDVSNISDTSSEDLESSVPEGSTSEPSSGDNDTPKKLGRIIEMNRPDYVDETDYSQFTKESGAIYRYSFGKSNSTEYITLSSGTQVRNCTTKPNADLIDASKLLPLPDIDTQTDEPLVLIYHTHTSESFLPYSDSFDEDYPLNSHDPSRNITAVGDAICKALSECGISSVHDCTSFDYPMFTGAYYRSEDSVEAILEEYPSIKIVLDIHRDGIVNLDGSLPAPIAEVEGKNAAQFMIITGCDNNGTLGIPNYMENFKLACLLQNCSENRYPGLARSVLFDYRNYNQHLSTGSLLIEMGSHGNSLDEVVYTGELMGNIIADAIGELADSGS